jgi:DNA polymerase elongation subunit (family B)
MSQKTTRILTYDIETAPAIGLFFGKPYDVRIAKIIQHEYVFGFAYKWMHEKKIRTCYIWDFPLYKTDPTNCVEVIKKWAELASSADIILGHNSDQFDYRQMHGRLMLYKIPPIAKPLMVDTKKLQKKISYEPSYKLDDLAQKYGIGRKQKHDGIDLWWDCMAILGFKKAVVKRQKEMVSYNKRDTLITELLYLDQRSYAENHPNIANIEGRPDACPRCGAEGMMISAGYKYTTTGRYRWWQCKECGRKSRGRKAEKTEKPNYV